jgi:polar amino acid transport system substrate-binding protein
MADLRRLALRLWRRIVKLDRIVLRLAAAMTIAVSTSTVAPAQNEREILAPAGTLRIGVYPGSPLSMVQEAKTGETHGLSVDLGKALAKQLDIPIALIQFQRIADVLEAMKAGTVDVTVSNATPARAQDVAFSQTLLSIELGYLVPAASPVATIADVDKSGIRVGVTQGSTSEHALPKLLPNATVVPAQNLKVAIEMFSRRELDAFATNKPILFEMSDQMPGAKVLDGRWGVEHVAVAIPKGREGGLEYLRRFVTDVQSSGLLAQAVERAGLRGSAKAQ